MATYILDVRKLSRQSRQIHLPPLQEIHSAQRVLSRPVVSEYAPFTGAEVRLIAAYRAYLNRGGFEFVWPSIVSGDWMAWFLAIHEAAELQAFAEREINPFDFTMWERTWQEPHFQAVRAELEYLRAWARQAGSDTSEIALETVNPIRGLLVNNHSSFVERVRIRENWSHPTETELQSALQFWQQIRSERNP